jgi:hypothetical protein
MNAHPRSRVWKLFAVGLFCGLPCCAQSAKGNWVFEINDIGIDTKGRPLTAQVLYVTTQQSTPSSRKAGFTPKLAIGCSTAWGTKLQLFIFDAGIFRTHSDGNGIEWGLIEALTKLLK